MIPNEEKGQWKPGQSGNPNGRPKKIYTILKESGYTNEEIRIAFAEVAWSDKEELERILNDPTTPTIVRGVAHSFKRAADKGDYRYMKDMIEQVIGQAKQTVDTEIKGEVNITFNLNDSIPDKPTE